MSATNTASSLWTADDVAARLGVKPGWVYARARAGDLPHVPLGRYVKFRPEDIERWIADQLRGA